MAVPAHLVIGAPRSGKTRLIRALAAQRPPGERWAVLVAEPGRTRLEATEDGLVVREIDPGCLCCAAVTLRVEMNRLLRVARPARLLIEASALEHAPRTIRLFADFWVAQAVTLHSVLLTMAAASAPEPGAAVHPDAMAALALADFVVIDPADATSGDALAASIAAVERPGRVVLPFAAAVRDGRWRDLARHAGPTSPA